MVDVVTRMNNARRYERYLQSVAMQGPGFTDLRTPAHSLPLDERGRVYLPPAQLFADASGDVADLTAGVLAGDPSAQYEVSRAIVWSARGLLPPKRSHIGAEQST